MIPLSIRWRLTLWYGLTLAVVLCAFCLTVLLLTRHHSLASIDAALIEELHEVTLEARLAHDMPELVLQLKTRFYQHGIYDFLVIDDDGKAVFVSSGLIGVTDPALLSASGSESDTHFQNHFLESRGPYRVAITSVKGSLGRFTVHAMTSLAPYHAEMQLFQTVMIILLPLALVVASIGGYLLAGKALTPVKQIAAVADSITIDCLDRRIEVSNPYDEMGRLAGTLNSLISRLHRAVDEIQRFTADASHEIRTPLAALRSEVEATLRARRSPEEYEQALTIILGEATRLSRLADQLLNLSRHDAGIICSSEDPVRLDALLVDVADQLRPLATDRGVTVLSTEVQPCQIHGDDIQLSQVLFNILENAIKYTPERGSVTARCQISNDSAIVEVEDTGIGILAEHLPHVLDRFYRVDPSRSSVSGGFGLGLSIAKSAVLAHGGLIEIRSEPGTGTIVTIRFPNAHLVSEDR